MVYCGVLLMAFRINIHMASGMVQGGMAVNVLTFEVGSDGEVDNIIAEIADCFEKNKPIPIKVKQSPLRLINPRQITHITVEETGFELGEGRPG